MLVTSYRITKFAAQNFWRNFWLSVITISMLILTLLTVNILIILGVVGEKAVNYVEDRIEVSVYFKTDTIDERVSGAVGYLRSFPQVKDVLIVNADDALSRFKKRHENNEFILQSLNEIDGNPFGPTLVVKAYSANDFPLILESLDNPRFRDDIREKDFSDYEQLIERIRNTTNNIRWFGFAVSVIFLIIAFLIIFNTVRIGIFIHKEEIGIMKLVGASNWFVRAPFLLESILYSFFATVITIGIIYPLLRILEARIDLYFDGVSTDLVQYFHQNGLIIFGVQFAILAFVNIISTNFAIRKYLNK